jgi:hypothetical protein
MEFALHYRGPLSPKANAADKNCIRRYFHAQMKKLCTEEDSPLRYYPPKNWQWDSVEKVGEFEFVALVSHWNSF